MTDRNYQVIARKWRPQRFDEVVGQQAVVRTLTNALAQSRIAHAYCFSGIRGVGKTTVARLLAKGLNCRSADGPTAEPCGECESCREVMDGRSMDVIERDAASDRGIHEMKELIEIARYSPSRDRYKVFILDEAHMLTAEASNALLKVLEEPPSWIVFVLATTEPNRILPTILSRCQHYQFGRISQREITGHLAKIAIAEGVEVSDDGLALLATAADGSLRDGQSLLDKLIAFAGERIDEQTVIDLLGLVDRVLLFRATELIADGDVAGTIGFVDEMVESGVDLHQFTIDLLGHLRNLLVVHTVEDAGAILHLPEGDVERLRQQAAGFSLDDLDRAFTLVAGSEYRIKLAEQPRYHLELVLARLARMPRLEPIEEILAALRGSEPGPGGAPGGPGRGDRARQGGRTATAARSAGPSPPTGPTPGTAARATAISRDRDPDPRREPPKPNEEPREEPPPPRERPRRDPPKPDEPPREEPPGPEKRPPATAAGAASTQQPRPQPDGQPGPPDVPDKPDVPDDPQPPSDPEPPEEPGGPEEPDPEDLPGMPPPERPRLAAVEPPPREPAQDLPMPALLRKIQERVNVTHPLIAQILGRSSGISLAGEKVIFQFPESAGIFVDRLRDPEMLRKLADAATEVTGRQVIARIDTHPGRPASRATAAGEEPGAPVTPATGGPRLVPDLPSPAPGPASIPDPGAEPDPPSAVSSTREQTPVSGNGTTPAAPADSGDPALRQQAEQEPLVQEFVKALRGQIVSVEEI